MISYDREPYEGPDIVLLWEKTPTARKPHLCDRCNQPIAIGQRYESAGWREDGEFQFRKCHRWAYQYPSGCPSIGAKDRAELAAQEARDQAQYFPRDSGSDRNGEDAPAAECASIAERAARHRPSPKDSQ